MNTHTTRSLTNPQRVLLAVLVAGGAWIAYASLPYALPGGFHPFLAERFPLSTRATWRTAVYAHVAAALTSLPACALLLSDGLRARSPRAHRLLGRAAGAIILLVLVPSGAYLSWFATGGLPSTAGFLLSGAIMATAMVKAILTARRRQLAAHRRWVLHVVAQMAVAVVSRLMLVASGLLQLDPEAAYVASLWIPVLGLAAWVELTTRTPRTPHPFGGLVMPRAARLSAVFVPLLLLIGDAADAADPTVTAQIQRLLVAPLTQREASASRYSRAPSPPTERRVRVTDAVARVDQAGAAFQRFAIDERYGSGAEPRWREDAVLGCIYPATGAVYVQAEGAWYSASALTGGAPTEAPAGACVAAGA